VPPQNKPNGQYHLPFDRDSIKIFMHDLSIRKVPGVGRVHERLLDAIGIKVHLEAGRSAFLTVHHDLRIL
jgi:nucleotidyltransferase/DNA polymerase involved in DNA repair